MRWSRGYFYEWIESFGPDCVLIQAGDSPFMLELAVQITQKYNISLFIYNSENYYFKDYNYFDGGKKSIFFHYFHNMLVNAFNKAMNVQAGCIYSTEALEIEFKKKFKHESISIYISSDISPVKYHKSIVPRINYLGNLGLGRHQSLIEIARCLHEINPNYILHIYGLAPNKEIERLLNKTPGIVVEGFVNYNEVKKIIASSDLLIHAEGFEEYITKDIKYGFSTKIADCLASGVPFFAYMPSELTSTKYLKKNNCAFVVEKREDLSKYIKVALKSTDEINTKIRNAKKTVNCNHNMKKNARKFNDFLYSHYDRNNDTRRPKW